MHETIWVDGCYDLTHFGHANMLRQAKSLGTKLIVGVHSDEDIRRVKRPPVYSQSERCDDGMFNNLNRSSTFPL